MAELVDAHDSKSCEATHESSILSRGIMKKKVVVILGPTASGKSGLAIELAKKFSGEVVSADSRQVYRHLNIGTGKITTKKMRGIKHHLLDVASPRKQFTVVQYKNLAEKAMKEITKRGKLPIICGGTGFYIQAIVDNIILPNVLANQKLRKSLGKKSVAELAEILQKLDRERAKNIDLKNSRRLIRAIEIAKALGKVPNIKKQQNDFEFLQIGIKTPDKILRKKISIRLFARISRGMIKETKKLHDRGLSWKRMEELGLEYRYLAYYLQDKMKKAEMIEKLETEIWRYAKRQKTWFKKDKRTQWFGLEKKEKIKRTIKKFITGV